MNNLVQINSVDQNTPQNISFLEDLRKPGKIFDATISEMLNGIKNGKWKSNVEKVRSFLPHGEQKFKQAKLEYLPAILFNGKFSYRKNDGLIKHSGFIIIDIDDLPNVEIVRQKCVADKHTYAVFESPSGRGLKVLFRTDLPINNNEEHGAVIEAIWEYLEKHYDIKVDVSGKDVARSCYVSYDPELFINKNPISFNKKLEKQKSLKPANKRILRRKNKVTIPNIENVQVNSTLIQWAQNEISQAVDGKRYLSRLKAGRLVGGLIAGGQAEEKHIQDLVECARANTANPDKAKNDILSSVEFGHETPLYPDENRRRDNNYLNLVDKYKNQKKENSNPPYVKSFNEQYVTSYLKDIPEEKLVFIKSTMGTGKTQLIKKHVEKFSKEVKYVSLTHRRKLATQTAQNQKIDNYQDIGDWKEYSNSVAIQVDSLHKLNCNNYKNAVVIIDEIDQVFDHMLNSETCKSKRQTIFNSFSTLLKNCKQVICLSADIPDEIVQSMKDLVELKDFVFYQNDFRPDSNYQYKYFNKEDVYHNMLTDLQSNQKVSCFCSSKAEAQLAYHFLKKKCSGKSGILITADTSTYKNVQDALSEHSVLQGYDYIIYSPVIYSGQDFNFEFSNKAYLIASSFDLSENDLLQGVRRFRQANELHWFVQLADRNLDTDPEKIYNDQELKLKYSNIQLENDDKLIKWAKLNSIRIAKKNISTNSLVIAFEEKLHEENYKKLKPIYFDSGYMKGELSKLRGELNEQEIQDVLGARTLNENYYETLKRRGVKDETERAELSKFAFIKMTRDENMIEWAVKKFIKPDKFKKAIHNNDLLIRSDVELAKEDNQQSNAFMFDNLYNCKKKKILNNVLAIFNNDNITDKYSYSRAIDELSKYVRENIDEVEKYLYKINLNKDGKINGYFLRSLAKALGYKLSKSGRNGNHWYKFDQSYVDLWQQVRKNRENYLSGKDSIIYSSIILSFPDEYEKLPLIEKMKYEQKYRTYY